MGTKKEKKGRGIKTKTKKRRSKEAYLTDLIAWLLIQYQKFKDFMAYHKTIKGILIEKRKKDFDDGGSGYYCAIVDSKGKVHRFWCREENALDVGTEQDVEGWDEDMARDYRMLVREWDGKQKLVFEPKE